MADSVFLELERLSSEVNVVNFAAPELAMCLEGETYDAVDSVPAPSFFNFQFCGVGCYFVIWRVNVRSEQDRQALVKFRQDALGKGLKMVRIAEPSQKLKFTKTNFFPFEICAGNFFLEKG